MSERARKRDAARESVRSARLAGRPRLTRYYTDHLASSSPFLLLCASLVCNNTRVRKPLLSSSVYSSPNILTAFVRSDFSKGYAAAVAAAAVNTLKVASRERLEGLARHASVTAGFQVRGFSSFFFVLSSFRFVYFSPRPMLYIATVIILVFASEKLFAVRDTILRLVYIDI